MLMKRTQVYLDHETWAMARLQAQTEGTTLSDILRRSLRVYVERKPKKHTQKSRKEFLAWIDELNRKYPAPPGTPTDLALEHDHYLYGTPKKYSKK